VIFGTSARENIRFGRPGATDAEIEAAAKAAAADEFISQLPQGYDTFLGERGTRLSGGQKQRIAIARALSVEPTLLICDEPTSALDVSVQAKILNLLMDLQQERGMAMVMETHDLAVAVRTCDRIAVMDHGRIVEDRPARDITNTPEHTATASLVAASH
jgi:ATP-binding cassette subfamily B protein